MRCAARILTGALATVAALVLTWQMPRLIFDDPDGAILVFFSVLALLVVVVVAFATKGDEKE